MASVVLHQTRLAALDLPWRGTLAALTLLPTFWSREKPFSVALPTLRSLVDLLLPPIVLAVPKKKVSHSRKSMRSAHKGLKDKLNVVHCPGCGGPKLAHHTCRSCYDDIISQLRRGARRGQQG